LGDPELPSRNGFGTLVGGWRIVRTMGSRITRLHPVQGFCAEGGGAMTLFLATYFGIPVSTTHTITGAIVGVGAARKVAAVTLECGQQRRRGLDCDAACDGIIWGRFLPTLYIPFLTRIERIILCGVLI
jgi:phosphate/sulfate permease